MFIKVIDSYPEGKTWIIEVPKNKDIIFERHFSKSIHSIIGDLEFRVPVGTKKFDMNKKLDFMTLWTIDQLYIFIYPFRLYIMNDEGKTIDTKHFDWKKIVDSDTGRIWEEVGSTPEPDSVPHDSL